MKIFVAYKFSGENKRDLRPVLENLSDALEKLGHETFIHFRDIEKWGEIDLSPRKIITGALDELENCGAILALITVPEKSEGLLLEIGYAKALGKKIMLAIKKDVPAVFLREIADDIIEFDNTKDLSDKVKMSKYAQGIDQ